MLHSCDYICKCFVPTELSKKKRNNILILTKSLYCNFVENHLFYYLLIFKGIEKKSDISTIPLVTESERSKRKSLTVTKRPIHTKQQ